MLTKLKNEEWCVVQKDDWLPKERYHISNLGRVYSEKHAKRKLNFKLTDINGYEAFSAIRKNKTIHLMYVHKIVAECFIQNSENKRFVIHKDHDKLNNSAENLAWATRSEMVKHNQNNPLVIAGKIKRKKKRLNAKLSVGKVKMIKRKLFDPNRKTRMRIIAKQFGISEMQLYRIKSGENWGDVTDY
ncbi:HNH endonuclease [Thalassobellus citreus]|uniref:HNH endonuclease n=1 Tax=Thalassobellus citreus TaxID=3367752 RepID=UPI003793DD18